MNAQEIIKMNTPDIIDRTNSVYNIFKHTVRLNQYRFSGMTSTETADLLIELIGTDPTYIAKNYLIKRIESYSNEYDTGIYY